MKIGFAVGTIAGAILGAHLGTYLYFDAKDDFNKAVHYMTTTEEERLAEIASRQEAWKKSMSQVNKSLVAYTDSRLEVLYE